MNILKSVDGNKTYIIAIVAAIFAGIHFIVVGDFSLAAILQFGQSEVVVAGVAALRHGIQKAQDAAGNQGNLPGGFQKGA